MIFDFSLILFMLLGCEIHAPGLLGKGAITSFLFQLLFTFSVNVLPLYLWIASKPDSPTCDFLAAWITEVATTLTCSLRWSLTFCWSWHGTTTLQIIGF